MTTLISYHIEYVPVSTWACST